jgi:hypothetical protein
LETLLRRKRDGIVRGWVQAALAIYPADVGAFYGKEKNSFANPVGSATTAGIEGLFDALVTDAPPGEFAPHLDRILQVRCVQGFPPSQAIWFLFALKGVLRNALAGELTDAAALRGLIVFESRIDRMAAFAFDVYAGYQKKIAEIRVNEIKGRVSTLSKMSKIRYDDPEGNPDQKDGPIDTVLPK